MDIRTHPDTHTQDHLPHASMTRQLNIIDHFYIFASNHWYSVQLAILFFQVFVQVLSLNQHLSLSIARGIKGSGYNSVSILDLIMYKSPNHCTRTIKLNPNPKSKHRTMRTGSLDSRECFNVEPNHVEVTT